jgi:transcriptional regulator with XRE-family HTH domain
MTEFERAQLKQWLGGVWLKSKLHQEAFGELFGVSRRTIIRATNSTNEVEPSKELVRQIMRYAVLKMGMKLPEFLDPNGLVAMNITTAAVLSGNTIKYITGED